MTDSSNGEGVASGTPEGAVNTNGSLTVPAQRRRAGTARRGASSKPKTQRVAAAGGGLGGTLMLSLAHQVPQDSVWSTILTWSAPGFAAFTGAVLPLLKNQGGRWGVHFKVWRSRRVIAKMLKRDDLTAERRAELQQFLDEVDKLRGQSEITAIREAFEAD